MGKLKEAMKEKVLDVRNVQKNLNSSVLKKEDYDRFIAELPDDAENAEEIEIEDEDLRN